MLKIKRTKSNTAFSCDATILASALTRINAITDYGQTTSGSAKQHLFVAQDDKLFLVGLSQDVTSYISVDATPSSDGICSFNASLLLGLIKKRKGIFKFEAKGGEMLFSSKSTNYKGSINLNEVTNEVVDEVNGIDSTKKAVALRPETLAELKRAVKSVSAKDIIFGTPLTIHIQVRDSQLRATAYDGYHALVFISKSELKSKNFTLSVTGSAYNVMEKFIANEEVAFSVDSHLRINKENAIYASIPSVQSEKEDYEVFEQVKSLEKSGCKAKIVVPGTICETISNMFALKSASLESTSKFDFEVNSEGLKITYKTTSGQTMESLDAEIKKGKKCKFSISEKLVTDVFSPFAGQKEILMTIFDGRFALESETESHVLKGVGTFDE